MEKKSYKRLTDIESVEFLNTLQYPRCADCIMKNSKSFSKGYGFVCCPMTQSQRIIGMRLVKSGEVLLCGEGYGKSQLFSTDLDCLCSSLSTLEKTKVDIEKVKERVMQEESVGRIRRVLHNIKTTYAHALQEMRNLIPDSVLRQHRRDSCADFESVIRNNIKDTARTLFRISKDLYEIKSEFSIYDKLKAGKMSIDKRPYNIRDIIMLVLYPFFEDFNKSDVFVDVKNFNDSVSVDFETFQIAIYHIIENMAKYVRPHTDVTISFLYNKKSLSIIFNMQSVHIEKSEIKDIFKEGYSGLEAKKSKKDGEGIGMYRAQVLLDLNGGTISVEPEDQYEEAKGIKYSSNKFIIILPL